MLGRSALLIVTLLPGPALAEGFEPVQDESQFLQLVGGRVLRIGLYDLSLRVRPGGVIEGSAMGWAITGNWSWQDGFFCRSMDWSGTEIDYNCQLVEARGSDVLRFTVDQGSGESATFRLR